ncbi:hypothetical protein DCAR_0311858 [Daucus carota subsp. sativus]|uniref:Uncharacterized protein n=1 Tax=Daucus carota subsp. sativus TaxID=79200 RepID=A0A161XY75_DAUCS|nr:hypothetical protein DCAR_0311858 [Daucus carota subsp. sativus]
MGFNSLRDINSASSSWKIKDRVVRSWNGFPSNGEKLKGINILLLDEKKTGMHAYVPANLIKKHDKDVVDGSVYIISEFTVKDYKKEDKFRCINSEKQIIFTKDTECIKIVEDDLLIPKNIFDFYDLAELKEIADSNIYLKDVIGVIWKDQPLADLTNRFGKPQVKVKFTIVDTRTAVNVTFWDSMAEEFVAAKKKAKGHPIIIIIASAKVTYWEGTINKIRQIEISNAASTKFYMNYTDPRVMDIRKMLGTNAFEKFDFSSQMFETFQSFTVQQLKFLGKDYAKDGASNDILDIMKTIENRRLGFKLIIRDENIDKKSMVYQATGVYELFDSTHTTDMIEPSEDNNQPSITQASQSSYHIDDLSQMNFTTPPAEKKEEKA